MAQGDKIRIHQAPSAINLDIKICWSVQKDFFLDILTMNDHEVGNSGTPTHKQNPTHDFLYTISQMSMSNA